MTARWGELLRLQGSIDMEEAIKIEANQQWAGQDKAKHPFVFTIETKSGRVYFIAAPSKEMMITWVDKLSSTFKFYLMNNSEDAAASGGLSACLTTIVLTAYPYPVAAVLESGLVPVNISLISVDKTTASVELKEATTARDVIAAALKKACKDPATAPLLVYHVRSYILTYE